MIWPVIRPVIRPVIGPVIGPVIRAALVALPALAAPAHAEGDYAPGLDAICALGQNRAEGCAAIRARPILDASQAPWSAIGRLNHAGHRTGGHCTGTLISDRVVLTAAHCLWDNATNHWIAPERFTFLAGYAGGDFVASSPAERAILAPGIDRTSNAYAVDPRNDWALLVLRDPIGRTAGHIPLFPDVIRGAKPGETALAGYAGLRPQLLTQARDCGAALIASGLILTQCSAMRGDSGGPLVLTRGGKHFVLGPLSVITTRNPPWRSVFVPFYKIRKAAIEAIAKAG